MNVCLSVCLSACLPACLSVCLLGLVKQFVVRAINAAARSYSNMHKVVHVCCRHGCWLILAYQDVVFNLQIMCGIMLF